MPFKQKMRIVQVVIKSWGIAVRLNDPYSPCDLGKFRGNKIAVAFKDAPGGCIIEHSDGSRIRYHGVVSLYWEPVCSVCDGTHPGKTEDECRAEQMHPVEQPFEDGVERPEEAPEVDAEEHAATESVT